MSEEHHMPDVRVFVEAISRAEDEVESALEHAPNIAAEAVIMVVRDLLEKLRGGSL